MFNFFKPLEYKITLVIRQGDNFFFKKGNFFNSFPSFKVNYSDSIDSVKLSLDCKLTEIGILKEFEEIIGFNKIENMFLIEISENCIVNLDSVKLFDKLTFLSFIKNYFLIRRIKTVF